MIFGTVRLERENDVLAQQLLTSKISMRSELDKLEDIKETLEKELAISRYKNTTSGCSRMSPLKYHQK